VASLKILKMESLIVKIDQQTNRLQKDNFIQQ
jgi:hypothetical protein